MRSETEKSSEKISALKSPHSNIHFNVYICVSVYMYMDARRSQKRTLVPLDPEVHVQS